MASDRGKVYASPEDTGSRWNEARPIARRTRRINNTRPGEDGEPGLTGATEI